MSSLCHMLLRTITELMRERGILQTFDPFAMNPGVRSFRWRLSNRLCCQGTPPYKRKSHCLGILVRLTYSWKAHSYITQLFHNYIYRMTFLCRNLSDPLKCGSLVSVDEWLEGVGDTGIQGMNIQYAGAGWPLTLTSLTDGTVVHTFS